MENRGLGRGIGIYFSIFGIYFSIAMTTAVFPSGGRTRCNADPCNRKIIVLLIIVFVLWCLADSRQLTSVSHTPSSPLPCPQSSVLSPHHWPVKQTSLLWSTALLRWISGHIILHSFRQNRSWYFSQISLETWLDNFCSDFDLTWNYFEITRLEL